MSTIQAISIWGNIASLADTHKVLNNASLNGTVPLQLGSNISFSDRNGSLITDPCLSLVYDSTDSHGFGHGREMQATMAELQERAGEASYDRPFFRWCVPPRYLGSEKS